MVALPVAGLGRHRGVMQQCAGGIEDHDPEVAGIPDGDVARLGQPHAFDALELAGTVPAAAERRPGRGSRTAPARQQPISTSTMT
jgi:hypothetical protein